MNPFRKLFGNKPANTGEGIAKNILAQEDRLSTLFDLFDKLPSDLGEWFIARINQNRASNYAVDIDLATTITSPIILPGDLVIKRNRDPRPGDFVRLAMRDDDDGGYWSDVVKVLKVHVKDGELYVQNVANPDSKGRLGLNNVLYVFDKIIKYEDSEWKKLVQLLNIDADLDEIVDWLKDSIEYVTKSNKFHDRENNLRKMNDRIKLLKSKK